MGRATRLRLARRRTSEPASSVILGIQAPEGHRLIEAQRGRITVADRPGLVALAGNSYGPPEAEDTRLIENA